MAKIVDPDELNQGIEIVINATARTIQLLVAGNLNNNSPGATSGVTLQAVYSFLKEEWKDDTALNKFRFPIKMYTKTDGIFINNWVFADALSRQLIRDAGWTEGADEYAGVISLGSFDNDLDQAYYANVFGYNQSKTDFDKTGNLNESILITGFTGYLKCFLRIADGLGVGKSYAEYDLLSEQNIASLEPVLYRLPLANVIDLKINVIDAVIDADLPYTGMKMNYLAGVGFTTWANTTAYPVNSVVKDNLTGRWYFTALGGTSNGTSTADDTGVTDWASYDGEVEIGTGNYYAFNRILTGNNGEDQPIYNWAQRQLRKATDINADDSTTMNQRRGDAHFGNVAELLLRYVGDMLHTMPGLYIEGFNTNSTNAIRFWDITVDGGGVDSATYLPVTSTERWYPFVAAGNFQFSQNLVDEPDVDTLYTMYFTNAGGNQFDTANAIIVKDNGGTDITGTITSGTMGWDFDYDGNDQGGRTPATDAAIVVVAQGLNGATWTLATYTITRATGQTIPVNADDERNYSNP